MERVIAVGDLAKLTPGERIGFYNETCKSLRLNPLTRPFEYVNLNGQLRLYARKDATDQLRNIHGISVELVSQVYEPDTGMFTVTAKATTATGRLDEEIGVVSVKNLQGEHLANARMKAVTKSKRRVTLSICGLGCLDETEIVDVRDAHTIRVDTETGEILEPAPQQPRSQPQTSPPAQRPAQAPPRAQEAPRQAEHPKPPPLAPTHPTRVAREALCAVLANMTLIARQEWIDDMETQCGTRNCGATTMEQAQLMIARIGKNNGTAEPPVIEGEYGAGEGDPFVGADAEVEAKGGAA